MNRLSSAEQLAVFASADLLEDDGSVERDAPGLAPTGFRIWRSGLNPTDHPGPKHKFTSASASAIMAEYALRANRRIPIDVNHLSHSETAPLESQRAVGWHELETRETPEGPELWAVRVTWDPEFKKGLEASVPAWRYLSANYVINRKSGEIVSYVDVCLTNSPAGHAVTPLSIAATKRIQNMKLTEHVLATAATAASKKMAAKECLAALFGDDEKKKTEAMLAIAAAMPDEEEGDEEKKKEAARKASEDAAEKEKKDKEEATRKASADEKEKKEKEEATKASADAAAKLSANSLAMATELQTIKAERALEKEAAQVKATADAREAIFAKRPDISKEQRAALETLPNDKIAAVLATWPRVTARPGSSIAAQFAGGGDSREVRATTYTPRLTAEEEQILANKNRRYSSPARAVEKGSASILATHDPSLAAARLKELEEEAKALGMPSHLGSATTIGKVA